MLFGKRGGSKELPDLPPSAFSRDKEMSLSSEEDRMLPAFPDSPTHNQFSQAAIKDAVGEPEEELPEFPETESEEPEENTMEMEEWNPSDMPAKSEFPVPKNRSANLEIETHRSTGKIFAPSASRVIREEIPASGRVSDVFVKIDKYHMARKSLNTIAEKLVEIDNLAKRIRETKLREEQELTAWERDIAHIKARIRDVTENIFEKID